MLAIAITTAINPAAGPRAERMGYRERFKRLKRVSAMALLFMFIIIYYDLIFCCCCSCS